ncbi:glycoside hydrolase family 3 protein [Actinomadura flavalba]|uniref:glycoside hydrolase family 3 protein n=1 Tax=Actinomadura flavalba TaxID=1120938 RepID=UPI0003728A73|nr:glycoside hydrolase family 3 protein [Actinomadura flavalba]
MRVPRSLPFLAAAAVVLPLSACDSAGGSGAAPSGAPAPSASPTPSPDAWIPGHVRQMSVREKVGQLFVPTFSGAADARAKITKYHVGGLIYFPGDLKTPEQTARLSNTLQKAAKTPLLLAVDEEQGIVTRAPYLTRFPGNMALGASGRADDARTAARVTATELRAVGINQDYAPVADVNVNPANPVIGVRSFGADPARVSALLGPAIAGFQEGGVAATAKHFPGHGNTATDSHTGLPVINVTPERWERIDAPPFRAAIAAGVDAIMSAHIVVPKLDGSGDPSTLSKKVLTGLLRERLGFTGVIVTDSLQMAGARAKYGDGETAVRAVRAGADQLLMPPSLPKAYNAVLKAVRNGRISQARLDESVTRILKMKQRRGLYGNTQVDPAKAASIVGTAEHKRAARTVAENAVTLVRNTGGVLPLRDRKVFVTGPLSAALREALTAQGVRTVGTASAADVTVVTARDSAPVVPSGRPAIVVALGRPYDLNRAAGAKALVATYSPRPVALHAAARVLAGKVKPTAKLPVPVAGHKPGYGLTC